MKQVKDKYTHTTLEQMPEHKLFRALMSGLNDFGFDCKAFAAGLQYYRMCREIAEQLKDHHLPCR